MPTALAALGLKHDLRGSAFNELVWEHICTAAPAGWLSRVKRDPFSLISRCERYGKSNAIVHDETLEDVAYSFICTYAARIWPPGVGDRAHLAGDCGFVWPRQNVIVKRNGDDVSRFEGREPSEWEVVVHSRLEHCVRYVKEVLEKSGGRAIGGGQDAEVSLGRVLAVPAPLVGAPRPELPARIEEMDAETSVPREMANAGSGLNVPEQAGPSALEEPMDAGHFLDTPDSEQIESAVPELLADTGAVLHTPEQAQPPIPQAPMSAGTILDKRRRTQPAAHQCTYCRRTFERAADLIKHVDTHIRPWKCPEESCRYHEIGFKAK